MERYRNSTPIRPDPPDAVRAEFDRLATDGVIGDPGGRPAYLYARVSSRGQATDDRGGLPRQVQHCHELAQRRGLRIAWDMVYADDESGFTDDRDALNALRREVKAPDRRADTVVIESGERLARDADLLGGLQYEFKRHNLTPLYWLDYGSKAAAGAMAGANDEGMKAQIARMADGTRRKARDGRVTSKRRAYGYLFCGADGKPRDNAGRDTYYTPHPLESKVVQRIYAALAEGRTLRSIAAELSASGTPPPRKTKLWTGMTVSSIVKKTLYKGEHIHGRFKRGTKTRPSPDGIGTITVQATIETPPEEWTVVPVPPLVDAATWQAANDMLAKNKATVHRRGKRDYLLSGLIYCASCGCKYSGAWRERQGAKGKRQFVHYKCTANTTPGKPHCNQGVVSAPVFEVAVLTAMAALLNNPARVVDALKAALRDVEADDGADQIAYLEGELKRLASEDERDHAAYLRGTITLDEFDAGRKERRTRAAKLQARLDDFKSRTDVLKAYIEVWQQAPRQAKKLKDLFRYDAEEQKRFIRRHIDRIVLDAKAGQFTLVGQFGAVGPFLYGNTRSSVQKIQFSVTASVRSGDVIAFALRESVA